MHCIFAPLPVWKIKPRSNLLSLLYCNIDRLFSPFFPFKLICVYIFFHFQFNVYYNERLQRFRFFCRECGLVAIVICVYCICAFWMSLDIRIQEFAVCWCQNNFHFDIRLKVKVDICYSVLCKCSCSCLKCDNNLFGNKIKFEKEIRREKNILLSHYSHSYLFFVQFCVCTCVHLHACGAVTHNRNQMCKHKTKRIESTNDENTFNFLL